MEYQAKLAERPPIHARPTTVLHEEPFKPKLESHVTTVEPFALQMDERLKDRKEYDKKHERELALRKEKVNLSIFFKLVCLT